MALSALADDARALRICSAVSRLLLTHCLPFAYPVANPMPRLTNRFVDDLSGPAARELVVWDDGLPGFGVRVKEGGGKSFLVQYRNANGRSRRLTLGRYGVLTPDEARRLARKTLADVAHGLDPAEARQADRRALTIAELCREYLERANAGLVISRRGRAKKGTTLMIDKGRVERHIIPLIGRRPIKDITSADIRAFQRDVTLGKTAADVKTGPRGRAIVKGGRGAATRTLGLLGAIMEYAAQAGYRADNPVRGVRREADRKRTVRLDEAAYRRLGRRLAAAERAGMRWQAVEAILGDQMILRAQSEQFVHRQFNPDMSLATVTKLSADWHNAVAANMTGPNSEFPEPWCPGGGLGGFDIVPITSSAELYREGKLLHHCAGTYAGQVHSGECYIFSVRKDGAPLATLQLVRSEAGVAIGQLRGACNAKPSKEVLRLMNSWLRAQREFRIPERRPYRLIDDDDDIPF